MRSAGLFLALMLVLAACDSSVVSSDTRAISGGWGMDQTIEFEMPALDSTGVYNVFLDIRNNNEYPFNNLFLIVAMDFPNGKIITDTLEYRMARPDGSWLGTGLGSMKENKLWYKEGVQFLEPGAYRMRISQAVRNNGEVSGVSQLQGITDIGYTVEAASQQ